MSELLACPCCKKRGFTERGLREHWCFAKAQRILSAQTQKVKLSADEIQAAIDQAKAEQKLVVVPVDVMLERGQV